MDPALYHRGASLREHVAPPDGFASHEVTRRRQTGRV